MSKKKKDGESTDNRFDDHDYHAYYKKARSKQRRTRRHAENRIIRDINNGGMSPEEFDDLYEHDDN